MSFWTSTDRQLLDKILFGTNDDRCALIFSLQRLLGMTKTKYLFQYIPNEFLIIALSRELLKNVSNGHRRTSMKKLSNV